jgi:hypothetical protein
MARPSSRPQGRDWRTTGLTKVISLIMSTAVCQIPMTILELMFASGMDDVRAENRIGIVK